MTRAQVLTYLKEGFFFDGYTRQVDVETVTYNSNLGCVRTAP